MKNLNKLWKSIWIIWRKRVWKNFFATVLANILYENWIEPLKEISIWNYLKENSYKKPLEWNKEFNYDYLLEDFKVSIEAWFHQLWNFSNDILNKINLNKEDYWFNSLNDKEKRELIEIFKTFNEFKTRTSLQIFWDYLKHKYNDPFFLSSWLLNSLKPWKYKIISWYINTDTRFITELLDFIIEWFYIISLENTDLDRIDPWIEHISEIELWFSKEKVWKIIDLKSNTGKIIDWVKRLSKKEFYEKIELIIPHLLSFQWYFKKDVETIKKLKSDLINWKYNFFKLQKKLSENFASYLNDKNNKSIENLLIHSYEEYVIQRDLILFEINTILKKYY